MTEQTSADLERQKNAAHLQLIANNTRKLDLLLSDIMDHGLVVADEDGKLVRQHPPAAYLKLVHERAKLYNMGRPAPGVHTDHQLDDDSLRKAIEHDGEMPELPPIDITDTDSL